MVTRPANKRGSSLSLFVFGVTAVLANFILQGVWLHSYTFDCYGAASSAVSILASPTAAARHRNSIRGSRDAAAAVNLNNVPGVACFFMVDRQSLDLAIAVRYSNWGRRCARFVIFSNSVSSEGGEEQIDDNTTIADIHHVIRLELQARDLAALSSNSTTALQDDTFGFTSFPSPKDEIKQFLSLKSFYSWMYMIRKYGNSNDVDYIMKADPDTYMLMDNYFHYISQNYSPDKHAYIGRVFKQSGNPRDPFVTGASVTLSKTTAKQLLLESTIKIETNSRNAEECSAEAFQGGGEADDYTLSKCLSSLGIYPSYTRDNIGRERFMHFDPTEHVYGNDLPPEWYREFSFTPHVPQIARCSEEACAFHWVERERMNDTLVWDGMVGVWHWKEEKNDHIGRRRRDQRMTAALEEGERLKLVF